LDTHPEFLADRKPTLRAINVRMEGSIDNAQEAPA
jgi:hypothetical protein